jgi:TetR/AcrR family transcriptional regulator, regulator of biofilm formation and stress response
MLREARAAIGQLVQAAAPGADGNATAEVLLAALDGLLLHRLLDPAVSGLAVGEPLRRLVGTSESALVNGARND